MPTILFQAWTELCLDVGVKSCLLLAAASMLSLLLRRSSASKRHWVWLCAMASLLILPFAAMFCRQPQITITALTPAKLLRQTAMVPPALQPAISPSYFHQTAPPTNSLPSIASSAHMGGEAPAADAHWPEAAFSIWLV